MRKLVLLLIILLFSQIQLKSQSLEKHDIIKNKVNILIQYFNDQKLIYDLNEISEIMKIIENVFLKENFDENYNFCNKIKGITEIDGNNIFYDFVLPFTETKRSNGFSLFEGFIFTNNKKYFITLSNYYEDENLLFITKEINSENIEYSYVYYYLPNDYKLFTIIKYLNIDPNGLEYQQQAYRIEEIIRYK